MSPAPRRKLPKRRLPAESRVHAHEVAKEALINTMCALLEATRNYAESSINAVISQHASEENSHERGRVSNFSSREAKQDMDNCFFDGIPRIKRLAKNMSLSAQELREIWAEAQTKFVAQRSVAR